MDRKVHFKTNILLKNIIGKDLITDDNVAILELVKNSYDAGSKIIEIRFHNTLSNEDLISALPNGNTSRILICDKGCGMDYDGLLGRWLNIAYSEKKENTRLNGRKQAGNKGVGRFSCDRLGKVLTIYTKTVDSNCLKMTIDWRLFENDEAQDKEIQNIEFEVSEVTREEILAITGWEEFESGTILDISLLRSQWTQERIVRLRRDLERFVNPNNPFISDTFQIEIIADEYKEYDSTRKSPSEMVNGPVRNKIFEQLDFRTTNITSSIDNAGEFIVTSLQDRGRIVFELKEFNPYLHLRNVRMRVYYLNPYSKRYFRQQTGFSSADFGSIFLFINGFRIPPYGDQGDDWLGIEKRKSLGFRRYLSTREVVGRIEINNEDNDFQIISSRTGVVNNEAFIELSRSGVPYGFFFKGFRRLERFVVEGIAWDKTSERVIEDGKGEEKYILDDLSRDKRILSVIRQIIDVDDSEIDSLHINEGFVKEILDEQLEVATRSIETVVRELSQISNNASPEVIAAYKARLQSNSDELDKLVSLVGKIAPEQTDLHRLISFQEDISRQQRELDQKERQLTEEREAKLLAVRQKEELERRLALEKEKNTYLLTSSRTMSEDAKGMVHTIKIISDKIHAIAYNTYNKILLDSISKDELLLSMGRVLFQADKAMKISRLITRANFNSESENRDVDVVAYISQYLDIYKDVVEESRIEINKDLDGLSVKKKVSVLDIAVILDNLISNSEKAGASKVLIQARLLDGNKLLITISDNGKGLDKKFDGMEDSIFDLGVTTTDGSGIGLHSVRNVLDGWHGSIRYAGTGLHEKGAKFELIIP